VQIIKFVAPEETDRTLGAADAGLVALKDGILNLQAQVDGLQAQIDAHRARAAEAVRAKRPPALALSYLRGAKRAEEALPQRLGALDNLRDTLAAVEGAARNAGLMRTYASGEAALRALLADPALERTHVEETMAALASANADAREIDDAIRTEGDINLRAAGTVDEDEIAAELAALVEESRAELQGRMPAVPAAAPAAPEVRQQEAPSVTVPETT
jgi:charged multivesicular body protein 7